MKVIIKLNCRKEVHKILSNKNKLKNLKPEMVHLLGEIKFSPMKVRVCTRRNWGPNVKGSGGQEGIAENQTVQ